MSEVFNKQPPYQIPTEFVQLKGAKMSGSVGNVLTLKDWLAVASPDLFRFLFFSYKPNSAIDFSLSDNSFILLNDRFERSERIYSNQEKAENEKIGEKIKGAYELSVIKAQKEAPFRIPYSFAVQLVQIIDPAKKFNEIVGVLGQTGHIKATLSKNEENSLRSDLIKAKTWVEKYAPAEFRFSFLEAFGEKEKNSISQDARRLLAAVAKKAEGAKTADEIQQAIFSTAKENNIGSKELFRAVYLALTGKESGPKAGLLIFAFGKEKCVERLKEAAIQAPLA
jgi:lysyl-tRNA synthetase class 1